MLHEGDDDTHKNNEWKIIGDSVKPTGLVLNWLKEDCRIDSNVLTYYISETIRLLINKPLNVYVPF